MEDREEAGVVVMGRAEIDTRAPFKSVKEAVMLFGERVLAGEIYANKLKEMREELASETGSTVQSRMEALTAEIGETKRSLEKDREEANFMAYCIKSLEEELEQTKKELREVKTRELMLLKQKDVPAETEDLKFIANATKEFQKKRYVKFANPPALAQVIVKKDDESLEKPHSLKKVKRKPLLPLIGWLFTRKKGSQGRDLTLQP